MARNRIIKIPVTEEEYAEISKRAGETPLATWCRNRLLVAQAEPLFALATKEAFEKMQTPEAGAAMKKAFNATPKELGEAAVARAARPDPKPEPKKKASKLRPAEKSTVEPKKITGAPCRLCGKAPGEFHENKCRLWAIGKRI